MNALNWWRWAEKACGRLSAAEDVAASDRELAMLFRRSRLGQWLLVLTERLAAAWADSRTRAAAQWIRRG